MSKELKKDWLPKLQARYARRNREGKTWMMDEEDLARLLRLPKDVEDDLASRTVRLVDTNKEQHRAQRDRGVSVANPIDERL